MLAAATVRCVYAVASSVGILYVVDIEQERTSGDATHGFDRALLAPVLLKLLHRTCEDKQCLACIEC
jgi:hypothetical protein